MRRAITLSALALLTVCLLLPMSASAQGFGSINGIGLIDYYREPSFKPGDWVKYRMTSKSELGASDNYVVTVAISGEEEWWGEDCFWVETTTQKNNGPPITVGALMSYDVFNDSLAITNNKYYVRKQISSMTETGEPQVELVRRPTSSYRVRQTIQRKLEWYIDTLEVAQRELDAGTFTCQKILIKQAAGGTIDIGDSSRYDELREDRTVWRTEKVPITSIAVEEIENVVARRTWLRGRSTEAPMNIRDRALGAAEVLEWGSDYESVMIPERLQRPLSEQRKQARN